MTYMIKKKIIWGEREKGRDKKVIKFRLKMGGVESIIEKNVCGVIAMGWFKKSIWFILSSL